MGMNISKLQERDSCLALVFLILIFWLFWRVDWLVFAAMAALLLGMVWPASMRPFAVFWFGLSHVLGNVMSRVLLTVVWLALVVPVGLARRMLGKDSMRLKEWRGGDGSVFVIRDHIYKPEDLQNPY